MKSALAFIASLLHASTAVGLPSAADGNRQLLFTQQIDRRLGVLEIYDNQEPADAVYQFSKQHGLDDRQRRDLLDNTCLSVSCSRKQALLWSIPVDFGSNVEQFNLYEGVEAADAVHGFVTQHNLSEEFRSALMNRACAVVECTRVEPVIFRKAVRIDGNDAYIEFLRGEEPSDVIYSALKPYGVPFEGRRKLFQDVKDDIPYSREHALLFTQTIHLEDDASFSEKFVLYDDGMEPVDVLYEFAKEHHLESDFGTLAKAVLPKLCEITTCTRDKLDRPIIWQNSINDKDGNELGVLSILEGDEPIDAIDQFVHALGIAAPNRTAYREQLLGKVCQSIKCTKTSVAVNRNKSKSQTSQPKSHPEEKVRIFYNLFTKSAEEKERVKMIVEEQFALIDPSLHDTNVRITSIGHPLSLIGASLGNASYHNSHHHDEGGEYLTLHELWKYCQSNPQKDSKVVYMHSKASFHPTQFNHKLRYFLTYGALSSDCANLPDSCNICSSRMSPLPHPHTPGNMWLARCDYVSELIDPLALRDGLLPEYYSRHNPCDGWGRFFSEHWIHSHPSALPCDLYPGNDFVWGYDSVPAVGPFEKELKKAPRFSYQDYVMPGPHCSVTKDNDGMFDMKAFLRTRREDYGLLYNVTGLHDDWWGWRVSTGSDSERRINKESEAMAQVRVRDTLVENNKSQIKYGFTSGEKIMIDTALALDKPHTDKIYEEHNYEIMYGQFLIPFYAQKPSMKFLEIGLGCDMHYEPGASIRLWKALFPQAELWAAEYDAECVEKSKQQGKLDGINVLTGDQMDLTTLDEWIIQSNGADFDVVVDDAGHKQCQIMTTFLKLWPHLKPGGLYFIEDLKVSRWPEYTDVSSPLCPQSMNVVDELKEIMDAMVHRKGESIGYKDVKFIFCQRDVCVLGKDNPLVWRKTIGNADGK